MQTPVRKSILFDRMKVVLISCVKAKLDHEALARDLYISSLFRKNLAYARSLCPDRIFVLSAKYGLVNLDQKLEPYEQTLKTMSAREIKEWSIGVVRQLEKKLDFTNDEVIFLAGNKYRKYLQPLFTKTSVPLEGMSIGRQLQFLTNQATTSNVCCELHKWVNSLPVFSFPFDESKIPHNGLYILFQKGETGHELSRIVRIGTHTGQNQLRSRLRQHFITENKDRSIFRKNIGRCLLNRAHDPFLEKWEIDLTTRQAREQYGPSINALKQQAIEREVSVYLRNNFSFVAISIETKDDRLAFESKIISTVATCPECRPSNTWLGLFSPKEKIRSSGLWLVNELYKQPLDSIDLKKIKSLPHILPK